jgi:hypothetical protein
VSQSVWQLGKQKGAPCEALLLFVTLDGQRVLKICSGSGRALDKSDQEEKYHSAQDRYQQAGKTERSRANAG